MAKRKLPAALKSYQFGKGGARKGKGKKGR